MCGVVLCVSGLRASTAPGIPFSAPAFCYVPTGLSSISEEIIFRVLRGHVVDLRKNHSPFSIFTEKTVFAFHPSVRRSTMFLGGPVVDPRGNHFPFPTFIGRVVSIFHFSFRRSSVFLGACRRSPGKSFSHFAGGLSSIPEEIIFVFFCYFRFEEGTPSLPLS